MVVPSPDRETDYIKEVLELKEEFSDKIKIYLGLEQDLFSDAPKFDFDYLIPGYEVMVAELADWMRAHKDMYPHYQL